MQADNHGLPDQWRLCRLRHDFCALNGASNFQAYPPLLILPPKAALEARVFKHERFTMCDPARRYMALGIARSDGSVYDYYILHNERLQATIQDSPGMQLSIAGLPGVLIEKNVKMRTTGSRRRFGLRRKEDFITALIAHI